MLGLLSIMMAMALTPSSIALADDISHHISKVGGVLFSLLLLLAIIYRRLFGAFLFST